MKPSLSSLGICTMLIAPVAAALVGCGGGGGPKVKPTATPTVEPTATSTPTPRPTTVYNFTVSQSADSNYGTTFDNASRGTGSTTINSTTISIGSSIRQASSFRIQFTCNMPLQVGDVFTFDGGALSANVTSSRTQGRYPNIVTIYRWKSVAQGNGSIVIRALTGNSATLELADVIIAPDNTPARGAVTFNETVRTIIN